MSEHLFNISSQFYAKLSLPLYLSGLESCCYVFTFSLCGFAPSRLCVESFFYSSAFLAAWRFNYLLRWQPPSFPPCSAGCATAAPASPVVAAFTPLGWRVSCLPPFFVAQKSQISGASRVCRRALRRQSRQFRQPIIEQAACEIRLSVSPQRISRPSGCVQCVSW